MIYTEIHNTLLLSSSNTTTTLLQGPTSRPDIFRGGGADPGFLAIPGGLASTKLRTPIPRKLNTTELRDLSSSSSLFLLALHTKYTEIARGIYKPFCSSSGVWASSLLRLGILASWLRVGVLASCWIVLDLISVV